jgi:hypothetical protein
VNGNVTVKRGVTIGIGLAVLAGLVTGLYDAGVLPGIVQLFEFLVALGGFFAAGLLSARDTGRIRAGVFAALIASALFAIVFLGSNVVLAFVSPATFARDFGYHNMSSSALVVAAFVQSLLSLIAWAAIGAGVGALGALVGRKRSRARTVISAVR